MLSIERGVGAFERISTEQEVLELLTQWERFADERSHLHNKARMHYKIVNYCLAIPAILLSTVSGTGNIGISSSMCSDTTLSIAFGTLGLISASLFSIHRYMNIPELQQTHDFYSDEFYKLGNEIRLNVVIRNDNQRTFSSVIELAKNIKKNFDICVDKAPSVPASIIKQETAKKKHKALETMHTVRRADASEDVEIQVGQSQ